MKNFITSHIKLEDTEFAALHQYAQNEDLSTAQLIRKILRTYLDDQTIVGFTEDGPIRKGAVTDRFSAPAAHHADCEYSHKPALPCGRLIQRPDTFEQLPRTDSAPPCYAA